MTEATPCVLGIDPGLTGGLAVFCLGSQLSAYDIPVVAGEVNLDELLGFLRLHRIDMAVIEGASSRPGQGVASTFKCGMAYGMLRACVMALEIPTHIVAPTVWKKLGPDKEKSLALAIRLWPGTGFFNRKRDHGRAEAALLARYGHEVLWRTGATETAAE